MGAAVALSGALVATAQLVESIPSRQPRAIADGRPPDRAFYMDLREGFDRVNQVHANWDINADWLGVAYRPENARFADDGLQLSSKKAKTKVSNYVSAEFQAVGFYGYGRYEVVMQAAKAPGVVSSFFVYSGPDMNDPHDEVDFEFLGRSPRRVQLNYFGRGQKDPADTQLWFDATEGEHIYAFEWLPESITWYADGIQLRRVTAATARAPLPRTTGRVMASVWAANRQAEAWVGTPSFNRTTAVYRCMSHVPLGMSGRQCSDTFKPNGS